MKSQSENNRKPNLKKWICPLDGKITNSRGAPAHLRNKHHIAWNKKFLHNPGLLVKKSEGSANTLLYGTIAAMLSDLDVADQELKDKTTEELYKLIIRIRINLRNNNTSRMNEFFGYLHPITSSIIIVKPRVQ